MSGDLTRQADLTPPLGTPGGPCQVVQRIEEEVKDPRLRLELAEEVERGRDLSNPEAAQVYDLEVEPGIGMFKRLHVGPHAQYRMDLRKVSLDDVRVTLQHLQKQLNDWKSQKNWRYDRFITEATSGRPVDWEDPKTRLVIAFALVGMGEIKLVTTFWKGIPDPVPARGQCQMRHGYSKLPQDQAGTKTLVDERSQKGLPAADSEGDAYGKRQRGETPERKEQALPLPSDRNDTVRDQREKRITAPTTNTPGESGSQPDGRSISKDKARVKGKPGDDDHPYIDGANGAYRRRPDVVAGTPPNPAYPRQRQHDQHGQAEVYDRNQYKKHRTEKKTDAEKRYRRLKHNPTFQRDLERRREHPQKFERKPGGGYTRIEDRSEDQRKKTAEFVAMVFRVAGIYERVPPEMEPDNRGKHEVIDRNPDKTPSPGMSQPVVMDAPASGKVIPRGHDFVSLMAHRVAARIADIEGNCAPDLHDKARGLWVKLKRVDAKNAIWNFAVQGSKAPYVVKVQAPPEGATKDINKVNVFVSCSCPFFRWQGPEHWAQKHDFLYHDPRGEATPPSIKDPSGQHWACKHVLAVLKHIREMNWQALTPPRPQKKASALRYLADRLASGRVAPLYERDAQMAQAVAARYLQRGR